MRILTGEYNPILRTGTDPLIVIDDAIISFGYQMLDCMRDVDGVGLAAPQVGASLRMFVATIWGKKSKKSQKEDIIDEQIFCNPEIIGHSDGMSIGEEGCLSLPGIVADVKRRDRVTIRFVDKKKHTCTQTFHGFTARIIQHEIDHLDGILYIDKCEKGSIRPVTSRKISEKDTKKIVE